MQEAVDRMLEAAMFKKFLFVFLASVLAACTGTPVPASTPSAGQMDTTATSPTGVDNTASALDHVLQNMHAVDQQTSDSFRVRNDAAYPVRPDMDLGSGYALLSLGEKSQIFSQNRDGWQLFYEQYPNAPGITTLSRVGFDDALDQALVYVVVPVPAR